jgi:hypothetical protein
MQASPGRFRYRHHPDGNLDSICLKCYRTVATAKSLDVLAKAEEQHDCRLEGAGPVSHVLEHDVKKEKP